ncbi:MAG: hypothetical protein WBA85_05985 [Brucella anthropi]
MQRTILISLFSLSAMVTNAMAGPNADNDAVCKAIGGLAATIMKHRQKNTPISDLMDLETDASLSKISRALILKAYEEPAYLTDKAQTRAVDTFRNDAELQCFKAADNK